MAINNNNQVFQNKLNILIHAISRFWYIVTFCLTWCKLSSFDLLQHFVPCLFNAYVKFQYFPTFHLHNVKVLIFCYGVLLWPWLWFWNMIINNNTQTTHKNTSTQNIDIVRFIKHFVVELCVWYGILIILKCAWLVWLMWDK